LGGVFLIGPQWALQQPSLIDLVETIQYKDISVYKALVESLLNLERFRPFYVISRNLLTKIFQLNLHLYFLYEAILIAITLYLIAQSVKKTHWATIVFLVILFVNPIVIDSFWRLGAGEPLLTIFLLLTVRFYYAKRRSLFVAALILMLLSKETAIFCVLVYIFQFFKKHDMRLLFVTIIFAAIHGLLLVPRIEYAWSLHIHTSMISFSIESAISTLWQYLRIYWPLCIILLFQTGIYLRERTKRNNTKNGLVIALCWMSLLPVALFRHVETYYLLPTYCLLLYSVIVQINKPAAKKSSVILQCTIFIVLNTVILLPKTVERMTFWNNDYKGDVPLIQWFKQNKNNYATIFVVAKAEYTKGLHMLSQSPSPIIQPSVSEFLKARQDSDEKLNSFYQQIEESFRSYPGSTVLITQDSSITDYPRLSICTDSLLVKSYCKWNVYFK